MNHKKLFIFDVETSGLDPIKNDILSLSFIIEVNGSKRCSNTIFCQPFDWDALEPQALMVNGFNLSILTELPFVEPQLAHAGLVDTLSRYVDKYNPEDKFYPVAYNANFDVSFLRSFFEKNDDRYFGSWFNHNPLDPLAMLRYLDYLDIVQLPDYKLVTVAKHFGFEHKAHDAQSDTEVLYQVFKRITGIFNRTYFLNPLPDEVDNG